MKAIVFLAGLGSMLVGAASYFAGVPFPFDCKSTVCTISTSVITLDIALMAVGIGLILISQLFSNSRA